MSFASKHRREVGNYVTKSELYNEFGEEQCFKIISMRNIQNSFGDYVPMLEIEYPTDNSIRKIQFSKDMVENVEEILADEDAVESITKGYAGFKIYEYRNPNQKNKRCWGIEWVDLDDNGNEIPLE